MNKLTIVYLSQIKPFRQAHLNRDTDKELLKLSKYLKDIADLDDFTQLNHKKWERFVESLDFYCCVCNQAPAYNEQKNVNLLNGNCSF